MRDQCRATFAGSLDRLHLPNAGIPTAADRDGVRLGVFRRSVPPL